MILYAIRHKATGELMPLAKRGKGYSHWNPTTKSTLTSALGVPRLVDTLRHAKRIIIVWYSMLNAHFSYRDNMDGGDYGIVTKSDGRTKDDLEVVLVELNVKEN